MKKKVGGGMDKKVGGDGIFFSMTWGSWNLYSVKGGGLQ